MKTITTSFDDLERDGHSSVTDYCRFLMELNPERYRNMAVEVYRGEMLCLIVKSVEDGAKIEPSDVGFRTVRPKRLERAKEGVLASLSDLNNMGGTHPPKKDKNDV